MFLKRLNITYLLLASGFWLASLTAHSQAVFSSEEDLKKQANRLFEEEKFAEAYPLFSQLLSLYPKDAQYNYKFGTCLLFASNDKEKAVPYIEFAAKRQKQEVDKEVFFYMGKAYHLNYRFEEAIRSYVTYKGMASSKELQKYDVDRQVEMCESGKRLLKTITELSVLEKKEVPVSDFFRSYNLSEFNAKLIIKPDDLKSSYDKKKNDESLMYLSPERNQIYYSSYGEDPKNGRDIYFVTRTSDGELSKPTRVSDVINTKYDEDYAFLHPDGKTLYFCSKGHNSMGGYDVFRSEWNSTLQSWSKPVNMDFAINTPDDDILFISDAEDKSAYFSSKRESPEGRITVYKIKLDRKPLDLAIITGILTKDIGDKMAKATITVTKVLKDEVVGVFNTNAADGSYTLKLPNGGKFMFAVESAGFKKSSELVIVPSQKEIKPMKQQIAITNVNGEDKIIIQNDFDAQVDSADIQLALQYIKAKASLEVSSAEEEISTTAIEDNAPTLKGEDNANSSLQGGQKNTPVTNTDIIEMAYQDAKETQKDANELRKNSEAAQQLSRQKNELSMQKYKEAQDIMKAAEAMTNQDEKMAELDKAAKLRKESEALSQESALSLTLSKQMDELATANQQQADAEIKYAKELDNAIKTGANEKKMNELLALKEDLDKKSDELNATFPPDMTKEINESQAQASKSTAKYLDMQQDVEDLQAEAGRLRAEAEKTKNDGVKQNLNQQAEEMEKEAEAKKKEADAYSVTAKQQQSQADSLKTSAALTTSVMKQIQSTPETTTAANTTTNTTEPASIVNETAANTSTQSTTQPNVITSPYVDAFSNQKFEAEKKTNELEKEQALAVVYQSWTDSLDNEISSLNSQLSSTTTEVEKTQIENKITQLRSSAEDKRQKAADSRNKVDNIKLQQALADASAVTPAAITTVTAENPETTTAASNLDPATITGTKNINEYYESKLMQNATIANEYEKKAKEEKLYQDWSASLYDESRRLKENGNSGKADEAMNESKAKQALAIQSADEVTKIKTEKPELVASANLTSPETTTSTTESKTETIPVPNTITETTTTATNTVTANSQTSTEPISQPENTNTTTTASNTSSNQSTNQPINQSSTAVVPESVVHKDEYTHFVALKSESDWSKKNAERQYKQAADAQKTADDQFKESQNISNQLANTTDPNEMQRLQARSDDLDRSALRNQAKADSIKKVAQNSEAESNSKRTESELYLQSLDKAAYDEINTSAGYKTSPAAETFASNTTSTETKTGSTTQPATTSTTSETSEPANTKSETVNTTTTTSNPTQTETTTSTPENPTALPETTTAQTQTSTQPANNESVKTETTTQSANTETTSAITKTETNPPATVSTASYSETLKYYDALFDKLELAGPTYSASKPIPVDAPMPDGLIFKIQIGAFRNAIPQDLFKGLKPITAETTPQGLKRYTAGLFQKFETAGNAKSQVNGLGYRDAFIVAFFNGKRISMNDALAKAREAGETISDAALSSNTNTGVVNTSGTNTSTSGNTNSPASSATNIVSTTDVKTVSGLFYTIQIGVFSRPVNSVQLYDISPLNSERTDNGLIRYTTGRFDDEAKAVKAKNSITQKGISDAFVIAYKDGKRISLSAAKSMIDTEGTTILSTNNQDSFIPTDTTTSEGSGKSLTAASNMGIVFKVQVGAFKQQVPIDIANKLLANSNRGIKTFRDGNGLLVYTIGEFLEYESANSLKTELVNSGLNDAFVIAFKDGKKMTATAALELLKNK